MTQDALEEGTRVGRFVVLCDRDGRTHAVVAGAVLAICETDEGTLLMLPGGRMTHVEQSMHVVLKWLDGRGSSGSWDKALWPIDSDRLQQQQP